MSVEIYSPAALSITASAAAHIKKTLQSRGKGEGLRINVKPSGCSGYAYALDIADSIAEQDAVFADKGVKVIVSQEDMAFLAGTEVDYVTEGVNSFFKFHNPLVKDACGCGESFRV